MKIINIVGTRPQFIKLAVLSETIKTYEKIQSKIIHTGQHFSHFMSDSFFKQLNIPEPDYHLDINSKTHGEMTGQMLIEIERILIKEIPDYVIVYGDCNTTLAGALAASKLHIRVAHVESGLRSFNKQMPEEVNRILVDHISDLLWVPTEIGINNLKREGICGEKVQLTGDLMLELLDKFIDKIKNKGIPKEINTTINLTEKYYVLTLHRQENTIKDRLEKLFSILSQLNHKIIFPIHPRTEKVIQNNKITIPSNIYTIESLCYLDMLGLVYNSDLVFTDSGGLQKESIYLERPTIILRKQTEWIENLQTIYGNLISIDDLEIENIYQCIHKSFQKSSNLKETKHSPSQKIVGHLLKSN